MKKPLTFILSRSGATKLLPRAALPTCLSIAGLTFALFLARFQLRYGVRADIVLEACTRLSLIVFLVMAVYWLFPPFIYATAVRGKRGAQSTKRLETLAGFITVLVRFFAVLFGLFAALSVFGINVSGILAGVGLGGLAISLAAKDTLSNLIGGVSIVLDRPFQIGDFIKVDEMTGTVEEIGLRSTRLRTLEDMVVIMPNDKVTNNSVLNYSKVRRRLLSFRLPVARKSSAEKIETLMRRIRLYMAENELISTAGQRQYLAEIGSLEQRILIECYICSDNYDTFLEERSRLLLYINEEMDRLQLQVLHLPCGDSCLNGMEKGDKK